MRWWAVLCHRAPPRAPRARALRHPLWPVRPNRVDVPRGRGIRRSGLWIPVADGRGSVRALPVRSGRFAALARCGATPAGGDPGGEYVRPPGTDRDRAPPWRDGAGVSWAREVTPLLSARIGVHRVPHGPLGGEVVRRSGAGHPIAPRESAALAAAPTWSHRLDVVPAGSEAGVPRSGRITAAEVHVQRMAPRGRPACSRCSRTRRSARAVVGLSGIATNYSATVPTRRAAVHRRRRRLVRPGRTAADRLGGGEAGHLAAGGVGAAVGAWPTTARGARAAPRRCSRRPNGARSPGPRSPSARTRPGTTTALAGWLIVPASPPGVEGAGTTGQLSGTDCRVLAGRGEEVVGPCRPPRRTPEIDHLDLPDRLHTSLRVPQTHLPDAVLRQPGRRATDRAQISTPY